jgi:hypothetical protein
MTAVAPEPAARAVARVLAGGLADTRIPATPVCGNCLDTGYACEDHPELPWEGVYGPTALHPEHGGIGMPCPTCCDPIPQDGTARITDAFTPRHLRG